MRQEWQGGRETNEYHGHKKKVHSLAWNCVGEKLASGSVDQSVRIWAIDQAGRSTGKELKGHQDSVDQLRWDPKQPEVHAHHICSAVRYGWFARTGAWDCIRRQDSAHMGHALWEVRECDRWVGEAPRAAPGVRISGLVSPPLASQRPKARTSTSAGAQTASILLWVTRTITFR